MGVAHELQHLVERQQGELAAAAAVRLVQAPSPVQVQGLIPPARVA
jgi:hypothetical protein